MMIDVVGWRLIERRQLSCVFLSLYFFSRGLALSMRWGGVLTSCAQCVEHALALSMGWGWGGGVGAGY